MQAILIDVQFGNFQIVACAFYVQRPFGLTEKMMGFFYRFVETEQHRTHLSVIGIEFVLNQGVAVVKTTVCVVVVVKPLVF